MTEPRLEIKAQLYCSAIVFACDKYIYAAEEQSRQAFKAFNSQPIVTTKTVSVKKTRGWWLWRKVWWESETVPLTPEELDLAKENRTRAAGFCQPAIPAKIRQIRAVAAHHKPSHMLIIEGAELALIAEFLAPSEVFASDKVPGADYSGRI